MIVVYFSINMKLRTNTVSEHQSNGLTLLLNKNKKIHKKRTNCFAVSNTNFNVSTNGLNLGSRKPYVTSTKGSKFTVTTSHASIRSPSSILPQYGTIYGHWKVRPQRESQHFKTIMFSENKEAFKKKLDAGQHQLYKVKKENKCCIKSTSKPTTIDRKISMKGMKNLYPHDKSNVHEIALSSDQNGKKEQICPRKNKKKILGSNHFLSKQSFKDKSAINKKKLNLNEASNVLSDTLKVSLNKKDESMECKMGLKCSQENHEIADSALTFQRVFESTIDNNKKKPRPTGKQVCTNHRSVSASKNMKFNNKRKFDHEQIKTNKKYSVTSSSFNVVPNSSPTCNVDFEENLQCYYHHKDSDITNKECTECTKFISLESHLLASKRKPIEYFSDNDIKGKSSTPTNGNSVYSKLCINAEKEVNPCNENKTLKLDLKKRSTNCDIMSNCLDNNFTNLSIDTMDIELISKEQTRIVNGISDINTENKKIDEQSETVFETGHIKNVHEDSNTSKQSIIIYIDKSCSDNTVSTSTNENDKVCQEDRHESYCAMNKNKCSSVEDNQKIIYVYISPKKPEEMLTNNVSQTPPSYFREDKDKVYPGGFLPYEEEKRILCNVILESLLASPRQSSNTHVRSKVERNIKNSAAYSPQKSNINSLNVNLSSDCGSLKEICSLENSSENLTLTLANEEPLQESEDNLTFKCKDLISCVNAIESQNGETKNCILLQTEEDNCSYYHLVQKYEIQSSAKKPESKERKIIGGAYNFEFNINSEEDNDFETSFTLFLEGEVDRNGNSYEPEFHDYPLITNNFVEFSCKANIDDIILESESNIPVRCSTHSASNLCLFTDEKTLHHEDESAPSKAYNSNKNEDSFKSSFNKVENKDVSPDNVIASFSSLSINKDFSDLSSLDSIFVYKMPLIKYLTPGDTSNSKNCEKVKREQNVVMIKEKSKDFDRINKSFIEISTTENSDIEEEVSPENNYKTVRNKKESKVCKRKRKKEIVDSSLKTINNDMAELKEQLDVQNSGLTSKNISYEMAEPKDQSDVQNTTLVNTDEPEREENFESKNNFYTNQFKGQQNFFSSTPIRNGKSEKDNIKFPIEEVLLTENEGDTLMEDESGKRENEGTIDKSFAYKSTKIRKFSGNVQESFDANTNEAPSRRYHFRNTQKRNQHLKHENQGSPSLCPTHETTFFDDVMKTVESRVKAEEKDLQKLKDLCIDISWDLPLIHSLDSGSAKMDFPKLKSLLGDQKDKLDISNFKSDEVKRIKKNWRKFSKKYGFSNPQLFLPSSQLFKYFKYSERRKFKMWLAKDLPSRRLSSVYRKFENIYSVAMRGKWSKKEDKLLMSLYHAYENSANETRRSMTLTRHTMLCKALGRTWMSVYRRILWHETNNSFTDNVDYVEWTPELEGKLISNLLKSIDTEDVEQLRDCEIPISAWKTVAAKTGLERDVSLRHWRYRLYPKLFASETVGRDQLKGKLITWLYDSRIMDWSEIDWKKLSKNCYDLGPYFLLKMLKKLVADNVPRYQRKKLDDCASYLYNKYLPSLSSCSVDLQLIRVRYNATTRTVEEI